MTAKRGLGKGLDMLIPIEPENKKKVLSKDNENRKEKDNVEIKEIIKEIKTEIKLDINQIEPNRGQPRTNFDEDAIIELADSIRQVGIIQPIVVQKRDGFFEIIVGERRWRAAKIAGLKEVPVIIKDYSDQEILEIALIENLQRENLNPIEEAQAYRKLVEEFQLKQDEIAERVSKSRTAVTNSMRLLKLDLRVQQMLIEDMISGGHARALLGIEDGDIQYKLAMRIFDEKMTVREIEKLVKEILQPKKETRKETSNNNFLYHEIEEKIKNILGTKVAIKAKNNNKGKIELEYYSQEELERIIELLEGIKR